MILLFNDSNFVKKLIEELGTEFAIEDLGPLHYVLGIEVHPTPTEYQITQSKYTKDLLLKSEMIGSSPISTPMALSPNHTPKDDVLVDPTRYRSLVGSLQYLTLTSPNHTPMANAIVKSHGLHFSFVN